LARKHPSPLVSGKPETWACGIVRTIGWANFLDDSIHTPHMKLTDIDRAFRVGESTGQGKSMAIRKMLKIRPFDWRWLLPSCIYRIEASRSQRGVSCSCRSGCHQGRELVTGQLRRRHARATTLVRA